MLPDSHYQQSELSSNNLSATQGFVTDRQDTTIAISETEIQALLDGFTYTNAIFLGGFLCRLYLLLALMHLALLPPALAKILVPLALTTALLFYFMR